MKPIVERLIRYLGTRDAVAEALGVTTAAIGEWLRGREPDSRSAALILGAAARYQIRRDHLTRWIEERSSLDYGANVPLVVEEMTAAGPMGQVNVRNRWADSVPGTGPALRAWVADMLIETLGYDWFPSNDIIVFFRLTRGGHYSIVHVYFDGRRPVPARTWGEPLLAARWSGKATVNQEAE